MKNVLRSKRVILVLLFLIFYFINRYIKSSELNNNKEVTIAKVYEIVTIRFTETRFRYKFFYNNNTYTGFSTLDGEKGSKFLNKFFEVEFSIKDPENNRIIKTNEIKNKKRIEKAGF